MDAQCSGLEIVNFLQNLSIFDKLQQFLSNLLPSYSVFNQFWFLKRIFLYVIIKGLWSCYLRMAFRDEDNFCKAFAGALVNMSYHEWQSHSWYDTSAMNCMHLCLCKTHSRDCPHAEIRHCTIFSFIPLAKMIPFWLESDQKFQLEPC